jgi:DNA-binding transcriptional MerR regulator
MLLKIGELSKRVGLTVRTLHYYDEIGLLKPSGRSPASYRMYNRDDIARLHTIQSLRQIGLPLNEIGKLLGKKSDPLPLVIQRQVAMLEHQIDQASELCARLKFLQTKFADGVEPDMNDWLSTLALMSAYGKYFTTEEIKIILDRWNRRHAKWLPIVADIRNAMDRGIKPDSLEIQPVIRRCMNLHHSWMGGDFELIERWQKMCLQEPVTQGRDGVDLEMITYIGKAAELRFNAFLQYFTKDEMRRFNVDLEDEWNLLADELRILMGRKVPLNSKKAQAAVSKWNSLIDRTTDHDPILRQKFLHAYGSNALIRASSVLSPEMQNFIREAWMASTKEIAQQP